MLLPLFALRALVDRDRRRLIQALARGAGAAVQLLLFYGSSPMRGHLLDPGTIAAMMFVRLIALPFLNYGSADQIDVVLAMRRSRARPVCSSLCLLFLLTGAIRYPQPLPDFDAGPSWPAEVAKWRRDHRHPLAVWPVPWTADLSDAPHVCAPIGRDLSRSTDPRYCEGGWAASFFQPRQRRVR